MPEVNLSGYSRVWIIENGASPANIPAYQGLMKLGDPTMPRGDVTRVEIPDPNRYDEFIEVAEVKGQTERTTTSLVGRYPVDVSTLLRLTRRGCAFDLQGHLGKCRNPSDFNGGWEKVLMFERARITQWAAENIGALGSDERNPTNETSELSAKDLYEVVRLTFEEQAAATVTREIISIDVCDRASCGDCGVGSDGCQIVLATQIGSGASPGTPPAVIYTSTGGTVWSGVNISTLLGNEPPADSECVGAYFVVISTVDESLHLARVADIILGTPAWAQVPTGFVFGQGPTAITSTGPNKTWLAAKSGYIYFTADPTVGVTVQEAGNQTTQTLNDIDAFDDLNVVAVGNSNAMLQTDNGGGTWRLITGPAAGQTLTSVKMLDAGVWLVGATDGVTGRLWYTADYGVSWTQVPLPQSGVRIDDIKFTTRSVGYLSLRIAGVRAQILRTIDGGHSWYVLPEGAGAISNNTRINQVAVCSDPNVVFGGGLGSNATDGIIVKAS